MVIIQFYNDSKSAISVLSFSVKLKIFLGKPGSVSAKSLLYFQGVTSQKAITSNFYTDGVSGRHK